MNRSLLARTSLIFLFALLILVSTCVSSATYKRALAQQTPPQQGTPSGSDEPVESDVTDIPAAPGTARAAKLEATRIVEAMEFPAPDLVGRDLRKEHTLLYLKGSVDGTYRSDNFLKDTAGARAFEYDANAAKLLQELATDPKAGAEVKDDARQALQKLLEGDRKVSTEVLAATDVFGDEKPQAATDYIAVARQELSAAEGKVSSGREVSAVGNYRRAWQNTTAAVNVLWKSVNPGGERLLPELEQRMGTDPQKADTDSDGLTDAQELVRTGTDPTNPDPASADRDSDGLTDLQEMQAGTDPLAPDTDGEGLKDGFETGGFNSDPTRQDTDSDGLTDDSEKRLGTDPRRSDTDSNGQMDGFENYTTEKSAEGLGVSVQMDGAGDVARTVEFEGAGGDEVFQDAPGRVSDAVDITSEVSFYNARVKIEFDPAQVPNGDYQNLQIMYWDEAARVFVPLDSQGVNAEEGYAWADTTHFTTFLLVHEPTWYAEWRKEMGDDFKRDPTDPNFKNLDVVLDIDSSGSMRTNDPSNLRLTASKGFVDALLAGDRAAVAHFECYAELYQPLTQDFAAAKAAIDRVGNYGGCTEIGDGVDVSLNELARNGNPDHLKSVIVLTDGYGSYDTALTQRAKDAGVAVYTVGLGSSVDEQLLRSIAEGTGGAYYPVSSANQLPELFQRIAERDPNPGSGPDADGDGLSDALETGGFRGGNGMFVTTKPNDEDTDDDGFTDGEEAGELSFGPDGDYLTVPTNPVEADPDGDGIDDFDEIGIGTEPNNPDSDFDHLSDSTELSEDFDPFAKNHDNDHLEDLQELGRNWDPYHPDRTNEELKADFILGARAGGLGNTLANLGIIKHEQIRSFGYLQGWTLYRDNFTSLSIDDIRDAIGLALDGDSSRSLFETLNLAGPNPTHGEDIADDIETFASWSPDQRIGIARWVTASPDVAAYTRQAELQGEPTYSLMNLALEKLGWDRDIEESLQEYMSIDESEQIIEELAATRNDPDELRGYLMAGGEEAAKSGSGTQFISYSAAAAPPPPPGVGFHKPSLTIDEWFEVDYRINNELYWEQDKLDTPRTLSEAYAVEAAVELLKRLGYELLYVGRNTPVPMLEPYPGEGAPDKYLSKGPDIIAYDRDNDRLKVVEVKGKPGFVSLTSSLVRSLVGGDYLTQASFEWLNRNAEPRYLNTMSGSADTNIQEAATLIEEVREEDRSYDAIWVGYGGTGSRAGRVTGGPTSALGQMKPTPSGTTGVKSWDVYAIKP